MLYDFVNYCTKEFELMPIESNNETYYTVNEALAYLGIARDTLYRRIDEGKLQKYRHGAKNRVYFRLTDLRALKELHPADTSQEKLEKEGLDTGN
jgi:excisionase family DNA binding protein